MFTELVRIVIVSQHVVLDLQISNMFDISLAF